MAFPESIENLLENMMMQSATVEKCCKFGFGPVEETVTEEVVEEVKPKKTTKEKEKTTK